jgi:hypothetical protein
VYELVSESMSGWQDCTALTEECGGGRHWAEENAEQWAAWRLPEPFFAWTDSYKGWACYSESVLRGARTTDLPETKFNPFDMQGGHYIGGYDDNTAIGFPDFTDPATLGALLALVREADDDERAHVRLCAGGWDFYTVNPMALPVTAQTEAQCLVAALEAAP